MPQFEVTFRSRKMAGEMANQTVSVSAENELKARDKVKNSHMADPTFTILSVKRA